MPKSVFKQCKEKINTFLKICRLIVYISIICTDPIFQTYTIQ